MLILPLPKGTNYDSILSQFKLGPHSLNSWYSWIQFRLRIPLITEALLQYLAC